MVSGPRKYVRGPLSLSVPALSVPAFVGAGYRRIRRSRAPKSGSHGAAVNALARLRGECPAWIRLTAGGSEI